MADEPSLEEQRAQLGAGVMVFAPELNGWSLDELQTAARALEDIEANPGWTALMDVVKSAEEQVLKSFVHGPVQSRADYARHAGFVQGLRAARTALETVRYKARKREHDERMAVERGQREESAL